MKKYTEYKDSNFSGIVPSDWRCWKLSHAYDIIGSGTTPEAGNPKYYDNGTISWLNTGDLNNSILKSCTKKITQKALDDFTALKVFPKSSLAIAMYGATIGKVSLLEFQTTVNQACCVFSTSEVVSNEFMFYWFLAHTTHIVNLSKGGGQPNISKEILSSLKVFCPSVWEQNLIAQYLDHKTAQIDKLIIDKEKLIALLSEERTAIINQAVTKGLNPDVPMKDSGIEWLGDIPMHWKVRKLKYLCTLISDKTSATKPGFIIALENIESWTGKVIGTFDSKDLSSELNLFNSGDVLFNKLRPYLAKVVLASEDGGCVGELLVLRPSREILPEFLFRRMLSESIISIIDSSTFGTKMPRASWGTFISQLGIPICSIAEQKEIVNYIHQQEHRIDSIIEKTKKEIELLKEFKEALISEVVTGKVDVRVEVIEETKASLV